MNWWGISLNLLLEGDALAAAGEQDESLPLEATAGRPTAEGRGASQIINNALAGGTIWGNLRRTSWATRKNSAQDI